MQLTTASLSECERVIERGMTTFVEVGQALMRIRDGRLYHKAFDTFEEYCQKRWGWSRMRASQLIASAEAMEDVNHGLQKPANERQARALTKAPKESRAEVWREAVESAPEGKVTAKHVSEVVAKHSNKTTHWRPAETKCVAVMMSTIDPEDAASSIASRFDDDEFLVKLATHLVKLVKRRAS